jgi:hypothetical protein
MQELLSTPISRLKTLARVGVSTTFQFGTDDPLREYGALRDVHPETLLLYDPGTHRSSPLYPQERDLFPSDFGSRLEKAIVSDRCSVNNWGCQPDRFTTDLSYPLAISDTTNAVSYRASFEPEGFTIVKRRSAAANGTTTITPMGSSCNPLVGVNSLSTTSSKSLALTPCRHSFPPEMIE